MNFSTGCDLEEIKRFESKISDECFLKRVYTKKEIEYCLNKTNPAPHLAARWCAKEAIIKAFFGLGINSVELIKIEIINTTEGYPEVCIYDPRCKDFEIKISLSHAGGMAMANAIIMKKIKKLWKKNERTNYRNPF